MPLEMYGMIDGALFRMKSLYERRYTTICLGCEVILDRLAYFHGELVDARSRQPSKTRGLVQMITVAL
jgi:hypothetical protein